MRTRHYIGIAIATLAFVGLVFAKAVHVPLSQKCKESDLIAVIEITKTKTKGASRPYRKIATARVIETIKGRVDGASLQLDFDNGLTCPNITYERGERCLVFLTKLPTGHFATYNTYFGAYAVSNEIVINWEFEADTKLDVVRKEIRKHVD
jgi:hypothetical protein